MLLIYKQQLRMAVQTTTNVYLILRKKWHFTMKASVDIFFINFYKRPECKVSQSTTKKQLEIKKKQQLQNLYFVNFKN